MLTTDRNSSPGLSDEELARNDFNHTIFMEVFHYCNLADMETKKQAYLRKMPNKSQYVGKKFQI
jgi:hypothetical protein